MIREMDCCGWNTHSFFESATADEVVACLAAGANPNDHDEHGWTPLHRSALLSTDPKVVTALLEAGAELEERNDLGNTPLHAASMSLLRPLVLKSLLEAGADANTRNDKGDAPLHYAVQSVTNRRQDRHAVAILLEAQADPMAANSHGETPLHKMGWQMQARVVEDLLDSGADCDFRDNAGMTALHRACAIGCDGAVIQILLAAGADPAARCGGWTTLHLAATNWRWGHSTPLRAAPLKVLLEAGVDVMALDQAGRTPLHLAAEGGQPSAVAVLLHAGADPTAQDQHGQTPKDYADEDSHHRSLLAVLLDPDADPMLADADGWRPLDLAVRVGRHRWDREAVDAGVISALLLAGADPIARDKRGSTPFHVAAERQSLGHVGDE